MLEYVDRKGSNCYKWDSEHAKGTLPMWVADMDFKAAPAILEAMQKRLDHGVFGYTQVPDEYYEAIINWFSRRHKWNTITREQIIYTIGVVPAISAILRALTKPGDRVVTNTPAYNCFLSCIRNLECELVANQLIEHDNHFEINWESLERDLESAKVFILCNPHNPTGRIWTREELQHVAALCEKHNVFVLSDEIHCEFAFPGEAYTPYATVAQNHNYCICTAASKAFNVAGLQCANIIAPNKDIHDRIDKAINIHEVCDINPFGMEALMAAYNKSEDWIDCLNDYIYANYRLLINAVHGLKGLRVTRMEGTYLAWVDIRPLGMSAEQFCQQLVETIGVLFNPSEMYGAEGYIRINMATSRDNMKRGVEALVNFVNK